MIWTPEGFSSDIEDGLGVAREDDDVIVGEEHEEVEGEGSFEAKDSACFLATMEGSVSFTNMAQRIMAKSVIEDETTQGSMYGCSHR